MKYPSLDFTAEERVRLNALESKRNESDIGFLLDLLGRCNSHAVDLHGCEPPIRANRLHAPDFIKWLWKQLKRGKPSDGDLAREVYLTKYPGAYGVAGYLVAVNGSPPRGTMVITTNFGDKSVMLFDRDRVVKAGAFDYSNTKAILYHSAAEWLKKLEGESDDSNN